MTMAEAYKLIPQEAVWSCSFGYPGGGGGYQEFWRMPDGQRYIVWRERLSDEWHASIHQEWRPVDHRAKVRARSA